MKTCCHLLVQAVAVLLASVSQSAKWGCGHSAHLRGALWQDAQILWPGAVFIPGPKPTRVGMVFPEVQLHHPFFPGQPSPLPCPPPHPYTFPSMDPRRLLPLRPAGSSGRPLLDPLMECVSGDWGPFKLKHPLNISQKFMSHLCLVKPQWS